MLKWVDILELESLSRLGVRYEVVAQARLVQGKIVLVGNPRLCRELASRRTRAGERIVSIADGADFFGVLQGSFHSAQLIVSEVKEGPDPTPIGATRVTSFF